MDDIGRRIAFEPPAEKERPRDSITHPRSARVRSADIWVDRGRARIYEITYDADGTPLWADITCNVLAAYANRLLLADVGKVVRFICFVRNEQGEFIVGGGALATEIVRGRVVSVVTPPQLRKCSPTRTQWGLPWWMTPEVIPSPGTVPPSGIGDVTVTHTSVDWGRHDASFAWEQNS